MHGSNRTCAWPAVERTDEGGKKDGGVEREEEVGEEIEANMADWMCHSQSVGRRPGRRGPSRRLINQRLKWRFDDRQ